MTQEPKLSTAVLHNGALLLVPALVITFGLWSRLPVAFGPEAFDQGIPPWLLLAENTFRIAVFGIPVFLYIVSRGRSATVGWYLYGAGMLLYLGSYLALIYLPMSAWSSSMLGFTAPAWTTLFWLAGIGLLCTETWLSFDWRPPIYISVAAVFVVVHTTHAYLAYAKQLPA